MNQAWPFLIPIVVMVALFTFLSIASWGEERRKEREALYRSEVLKKLADQLGSNAGPVLEFIREQERTELRKKREGLKLGGLITSAAGIGVILLLRAVAAAEPIWVAGAIPLLIGVAMLLYVYVLAPKELPARAA